MKTMLAALAIATSATVANALPFQLDATPTDGVNTENGAVFSIIFDDLDNDMLFSFNELTSISGVFRSNGEIDSVGLESAPVVSGFTDGGSAPGASLPPPPLPNFLWIFIDEFGGTQTLDTGSGFGQTISLDYTLSPVEMSAVPLPAPIWMLLTGIVGLGFLRRKS